MADVRALGCLCVIATSACAGIAIDGPSTSSEDSLDFGVVDVAVCQEVEPFDVRFGGCSEFVGVTFVPVENVRSRVPADYALAVYTSPAEAVVVVRIADCKAVQVRDKTPRAAQVVQVGVVLAGIDSGSNIDNYTLWYVTNDQRLQRELSEVGVPAEYSKHLSYSFAADDSGTGPLEIVSKAKHAPGFVVKGTGTLPTGEAIPFQASWWYDGVYGTIQMETYLPTFYFGVASAELTTKDTALRALFGTPPVTFPGLDSYNTFDEAFMQVLAP